jgi:tryptophan synthase alpha chain
VRDKLTEIRSCTDLPVGVGFGIKDPETAAAMAEFADAVVVGSALVSRIEANLDQPHRAVGEIQALLADMRAAMDQRAQAAAV